MTDPIAILLSAASFAADRHREQRRKDVGASPYINHPLDVASVLANAGVTDTDLLCAALLHDTIEDTQTTADEITQRFGPKVCGLVLEVTDDKSLPKPQRKQLQIDQTPFKSELAKQLKVADKICNVRDIDEASPAGWDRERKLAYLDWAVAVIAGCRGVCPVLDKQFDGEIAAAQGRLKNKNA